ncbi:hypothetical protein A4H97_33730 [Niastella yeongjuensis]|uniref:AAA+ ATPase domain-containing protein n=1 Tax=Niastella yeongjuensis TaxID=354355 RepID=A0A1V9EDU0_9BACT|nr:AAA family ATPase [Niastella yeongjuensis]OQP44134.1 hypothetical protein A4H97_33730 [Niastella yeongjuensis]SEP49237.1 AAA domain-containing protein [Niastella yeongjuensis]
MFKKTMQEARAELKHDQKPKLFYSGLDLLNFNIEKVPMLWEPFFPAKGLVGFTGASDCGKSLFLRQLAMAVAMQKKTFLDYPLNVKHGKAIYVSTEDELEGVGALLQRQIGKAERKSIETLFFIFNTSNILNNLREAFAQTPYDLVVFDVWSDIFHGNPNNWVEIRKELSELKLLADEYNTLIVILHHTVKNSEKNVPDKNKLNGSQAIEAKIRSLLELRHHTSADERLLTVLKNNYIPKGEKEDSIVLKLNPENLLFSNSGEKISIIAGGGNRNKYDVEVWVQRIEEVRKEGASYEQARRILVEQYGEKEVPGLTWFKNQAGK